MIGTLRGTLAFKQPPQIVVECGGVGYEVETPLSTFLELPAAGAEVRLFTHLHVREDAQILYGFSTAAEKSLFRTLLKVSGVGAKMALSVLSAMSVADFTRCVRHEDTATLVRIPGVGRKTAERLIIEMRDRLEESPVALRTGGNERPRGRRAHRSLRCAGIAGLQARRSPQTAGVARYR